MADNVTIPASGTGDATPIVGTDKIGGVDYQRVKIILGGDGTNSGDLASGAGAVSALTPRVTLGSDDPAVASLATIATNTGNTATSLAIIDDWDETDRAKVNIIVGQAGVTAGAGAVDAATQRVTLASDDPAVTSLALIDDIVHNGATALSKYAVVGFQYDDVSPTLPSENQVQAARMSSRREVYVVQRDAAGGERGMNIDYMNRGNVAVAQDVITISGNVSLAPQRQPVNVNSNGQIVISGMANRKIRVLNGALMAASAVTINLKSNHNSDVTGPLFPGANGGYQIPQAEIGNFETLVGHNLTISMSTGVQVGGWLTYVYV